MMSELRWALLILGVLFVVVLAWWERRRPRQASGALDRSLSREGGADAPPRRVREPPLTLPEMHAYEPIATRELPVVAAPREELPESPEEAEIPMLDSEAPVPAAEAAEVDEAAEAAQLRRDEEPPPFQDEDTVDDLLAIVPAQEIPEDQRAIFEDSEPVASPASVPVAAADAPTRHEGLPEPSSTAPPVVDWPAEHERRILTLRLVAPQRERFAGRSLRQALAAEGFLLGQFAIFHKPDDEHRAVLSAASLTRPGTFDMETMDSQHYGGLSLFAVLPGPKSPPQAFDELVFAARNLNERLHGVLQDDQGTPLTPARIAQLREQLRAGASS
jgi:cell division protein ZipA